MQKTIMLCAICNLQSGGCSEDCKYCTQSGFVKTGIEKFPRKSIERIVEEAHIAKNNHALGFCLVTAGLGLDDDKLAYVCEAARAVKKAQPDLMLIACNGLASFEQLVELKKAGIFSYNHNLETSCEFFPQICTTHSWESRFETNLNAKRAGIELCCGGIYGVGESESDRESFRASLKELAPFTSPVNFFIKNEHLPLNPPPLSVDEALRIVEQSAKELAPTRIMIAGGREKVLGSRQYEVFERGASAVVIGDYLTTKGEVPSADIANLQKMGLSFATQCH